MFMGKTMGKPWKYHIFDRGKNDKPVDLCQALSLQSEFDDLGHLLDEADRPVEPHFAAFHNCSQ